VYQSGRQLTVSSSVCVSWSETDVAPLIFWRCGRHTDRQDRWMSAKLRPISQIDVCNGDPRLYDECVFSQQVGWLVGWWQVVGCVCCQCDNHSPSLSGLPLILPREESSSLLRFCIDFASIKGHCPVLARLHLATSWLLIHTLNLSLHSCFTRENRQGLLEVSADHYQLQEIFRGSSPTGRFMFLLYFLSFFSWLLFDLDEPKWIFCYSICFWSLSSHPLIFNRPNQP
jgi:hypothetical protein